ncbi:MAG: gliding motility lipoprotein GldB [Cyclobacteriaceae bacterium]
MKNALLFTCIVLGMYSCGDKETTDECREQPDISGIEMNVDIERLDKAIFESESPEELGQVLQNNPVLTGYYLPEPAMASDTSVLKDVLSMIRDESLDTLYREVGEMLGNAEQLEGEYEEAFKNYKSFVPSFNPPEVKTMLTGMAGYADLYVSDSLILVGADYFLGPGATYRPVNTPEYLQRRYSPEYIVPSSVLFLSKNLNAANQSDKTLLADMIYYGKSYYFLSRVMPCLADSTLLGYTRKEIEGTRFNRQQIWKHFIDNDLLYETNHFIKTKYTGERPKTFEVSNDAPGRVGIWLGLDIVREYMRNNPEVTVSQLMKNDKVQEIFEKSRYRPVR